MRDPRRGKIILAAAIIWKAVTPLESEASPPACIRTDAEMFHISDSIVEVEVVKAKRWTEHGSLHLMGHYRIQQVFKGKAKTGSVIIVEKSCIDQAVPQEMTGYPPVRLYCPKGAGLVLTGVNAEDASADTSQERWILFLKRTPPDVKGPRTWSEVDPTGFADRGCFTTVKDLPPREQEGFRQMKERKQGELK